MSIDKIRTRVFLTSNLTVTGTETVTGQLNVSAGTIVLPYSGSPTPFTTAGGIAGGSVAGKYVLYLRGAGTTYIMTFPTVASGGSITVTSV